MKKIYYKLSKKLKKTSQSLLYLLFLYPLYLLSFICIRNKKIWLFSNHTSFRDNSKYFYLHMKNLHPEIMSIWLTSNKKELFDLKQQNIMAVYRWSIRGLYYSLRAKVYIFDSYVSDINIWTSGNTLKVNLWHGVGIKNIERLANIGVCKKIFHGEKWYQKINYYQAIKYPAHYIRPNLFLSTSPLMTSHFSKAFGINPKNCIEALYPRCQLFFSNDETLMNSHLAPEIKKLIQKLSKYTKIYLYAPTWRDSHIDFLTQANFNLNLLNQTMQNKNQVFIFKLHPNTNLNIDVTIYSNIIVLPTRLDIYPILQYVNCLITDYSSIYYDFILMSDKEVVLFPFDYDTFISQERDLAFDFTEHTEGHLVYSFSDLMNFLILENYSIDNYKLSVIKDKFWSSSYLKDNEHIYQSIYSKLSI